MVVDTDFMRRLGLRHPVIQAPMAGGGDTPELVAAVGASGGLGFIGGAYLTPERILEAARSVRKATDRPFGINLFAPQPAPESPPDSGAALDRMAPYFAELDLPPPSPPDHAGDPFDDQLAAVLESGASIFSVTFGIPPAAAIDAVKSKGIVFAATATTVEEAVAIEAAGVDAVIAQGSEAGGHRGTFDADSDLGLVGSMALVPQVADAVSLLVIASGGIMDGRGIAAALALGAEAVQMGTAFLVCDEAGIVDAYKQAILGAGEHETRVTRAFSGRPARGIVNRVMNEVAAEEILPFPLQNALTRPLRTAAAKAGRVEFLSLWAGQGVGLARRQPAATLVARLAEETEAAISGLTCTKER